MVYQDSSPTCIGVRDQFRLGGLRSVARIFSPLLARKSSGFARILPDFLPEYGYFENSRGGGAAAPQPPASYAYAYMCILVGFLILFLPPGSHVIAMLGALCDGIRVHDLLKCSSHPAFLYVLNNSCFCFLEYLFICDAVCI